MGLMKNVYDKYTALSKADPRVIELVESRIGKQDDWNDLFATKLIELLDKNDAIRDEIKKRLAQLEQANRAQQELIRSAEEHRRLNVAYEETIAALTVARKKFEQAEALNVAADELRKASKDYKNADAALVRARADYEAGTSRLITIQSSCEQSVVQSHAALNELKIIAEQASLTAVDVAQKADLAGQSWKESNSSLKEALAFERQAIDGFKKATSLTNTATAKQTAAAIALDKASTQAQSAAGNHEAAQEKLSSAQRDAKSAEAALIRATALQMSAAKEFDHARNQLRNVQCFSVVVLTAACSMAAWSVSVLSQRFSLPLWAPISVTLLALGLAVLAWKRVE
jgi:hypothetical protein